MLQLLHQELLHNEKLQNTLSVPLQLLQLAAATAVLGYMRPAKHVTGILMCRYELIQDILKQHTNHAVYNQLTPVNPNEPKAKKGYKGQSKMR